MGSSPRMRGAHHPEDGRICAWGIIPADAGSTAALARLSTLYRDHPRGCGEHVVAASVAVFRAGSSPRMRGAPGAFRLETIQSRIIPADAGSTCTGSGGESSFWDHPRGCGEHFLSLSMVYRFRGSSPRMRGAQCRIPGSRCSAGIIPADAGSTRANGRLGGICKDHPRGCGEHYNKLYESDRLKDHPRGCGEHLRSLKTCTAVGGSSPRMRGALRTYQAATRAAGIIPADAGSTMISTWPFCNVQDHPRGCGEHKAMVWCHNAIPGSSPRMRGALPGAVQNRLCRRIIPADAGSTACRHRGLDAAVGSSPRMRGARLSWCSFPACLGIIPADAGSTERKAPKRYRPTDHPRGCGEHVR